MLCTRRTKTLVSTCVILSGMTNIVCLLYVGWITNFVAKSGPKVAETGGKAERKLEEEGKGETLRIMERLDKLESVVNEHIKDNPAKEDEDASSSSASDPSSSLFDHWGHDLGPESRRVASRKFRYYGYNSYLSDRLSITRPIPDFRPDGCKNMWYSSELPQLSIIFIFVNEALSVLLRSVHTAIQRTPSHLLKEIILVDDHSTNLELKENLQNFVDETNAQHGPEFIKVVHHDKQEGLIRSRVSGWRIASAPVVALFDAHVEFNTGWAEPVLQRIKEDRTRVVSPSFDNIKYDTFEMEEYPLSAQGFDWELWCRYLNPPKSWWSLRNHTAPIRSPALIGCFAVDRKYFEEIGLLDEGMEVYGGENVELGIRVWQCGGSVEVLPCSRIAHIERAHKPYTENLTALVRRNALRVAEVWMDNYKSHVYMAWNVPFQNSGIDIGDISERRALRSRLKCQPFSWFLANIYPELRSYSNTVAYGVLKNSLRNDLCLDQGPDTDNIPIMYLCHGMTAQNVYYTSSQQLHLGVLSPTIDDDDNKCLVDVNSKPRLLECAYAATKHMKLTWTFTPRSNQGDSFMIVMGNRFTPKNLHQRPTVALLCGPHVQGAQGISCGRHLANHEVEVILFLPNFVKMLDSVTSERTLFSKTGGKLVSNIKDLPDTPVDLIINSLDCHENTFLMDQPWYRAAAEWANQNRAPVLSLDPPVSGQGQAVEAKWSLSLCLPLPLAEDAGRVYLCDIGIPRQVFQEVGIKYLSPFGCKFVIPLHSA